ncbi:hypothetical protein CEXT_137331, partial [Caerostris extrusa]
MRKQKDFEILNKEAETRAALEKKKENEVTPVPTADPQMNGAAIRRKIPTPDDDEGFTRPLRNSPSIGLVEEVTPPTLTKKARAC